MHMSCIRYLRAQALDDSLAVTFTMGVAGGSSETKDSIVSISHLAELLYWIVCEHAGSKIFLHCTESDIGGGPDRNVSCRQP